MQVSIKVWQAIVRERNNTYTTTFLYINAFQNAIQYVPSL